MSDLDRFARFAERLADTSRPILQRYFRTPVAVETKADRSPVTVADKEAEAAIRAMIGSEFPDHGIVGEEHGSAGTSAEYVWVIDPLDGTRSFVTGKPLFGTLIALLHRGKPVVGVIDVPVMQERWVGIDGQPTTFNGAAVKVRPCPDLALATGNATTPDMFKGDDIAAVGRLKASLKGLNYGGDCYAYGLVTSGFIDLVVEASLQTYDFCALVPVLTGAGGIATDWAGQPLGLQSDGRMLASGDARVHAAALEKLRG